MDKSTPAAFRSGSPPGRVWKGEKAVDYNQISISGQTSPTGNSKSTSDGAAAPAG
jgi:hypothetical protein